MYRVSLTLWEKVIGIFFTIVIGPMFFLALSIVLFSAAWSDITFQLRMILGALTGGLGLSWIGIALYLMRSQKWLESEFVLTSSYIAKSDGEMAEIGYWDDVKTFLRDGATIRFNSRDPLSLPPFPKFLRRLGRKSAELSRQRDVIVRDLQYSGFLESTDQVRNRNWIIRLLILIAFIALLFGLIVRAL